MLKIPVNNREKFDNLAQFFIINVYWIKDFNIIYIM